MKVYTRGFFEGKILVIDKMCQNKVNFVKKLKRWDLGLTHGGERIFCMATLEKSKIWKRRFFSINRNTLDKIILQRKKSQILYILAMGEKNGANSPFSVQTKIFP